MNDDNNSHAAINQYVYHLIQGGQRKSADELGDVISAMVSAANPVAGMVFEAGRAAMRQDDDDSQ